MVLRRCRDCGRANLAQRVVVAVALAGVLALAGTYIVDDGFTARGGGWFSYAPGSNEVFFLDAGLDPFPRLLVWAGLIVVGPFCRSGSLVCPRLSSRTAPRSRQVVRQTDNGLGRSPTPPARPTETVNQLPSASPTA